MYQSYYQIDGRPVAIICVCAFTPTSNLLVYDKYFPLFFLGVLIISIHKNVIKTTNY